MSNMQFFEQVHNLETNKIDIQQLSGEIYEEQKNRYAETSERAIKAAAAKAALLAKLGITEEEAKLLLS